MEESANRSGQPKLVLAGTLRRQSHSIMPQLKVQVPRFMITLYINVLTGCDFLTPQCKFCDCAETDWPHLLFKCPNLRNGHNFILKFQNNFETAKTTAKAFESSKITHAKCILSKLWNEKRFDDLFYMAMGVNLTLHELEYQFIIEILIKS